MAKQKDGRYRSKVTVGTGPDGAKIFKYASGRTKKELAANTEELKRVYVGGSTDLRRDVLFGAYVQEWYDTYKKQKLSESSRRNYASILNKHLLPALGQRQLRAITATDLQKLLNSKQGMGASTLGDMHSILRNVFRLATVHGILDRDPAMGLVKPSAEKEKRRALTDAEVAAARKVGYEHPEGLLLLILYFTGVRIGEALGMQWQDIDFQNRTVKIERDIDFKTNEIGTVKTESSIRLIPLPDELYEALNARRGFGGTFVLQAPKTHSHLSQSTYKRRWNRLMHAMFEADPSIESKVVDVQTDGDGNELQLRASILTAHYFRHNYASVLYNADVDILSAQRFLGHADVKTTLAVYAHLSKGKEDKNAEKVRTAFRDEKKVARKLPDPKKDA